MVRALLKVFFFRKEAERFLADKNDGQPLMITGWLKIKRSKPFQNKTPKQFRCRCFQLELKIDHPRRIQIQSANVRLHGIRQASP